MQEALFIYSFIYLFIYLFIYSFFIITRLIGFEYIVNGY